MKKLNPTQQLRVKRFWNYVHKWFILTGTVMFVTIFLALCVETYKFVADDVSDRLFPPRILYDVYDADSGEYDGVILSDGNGVYPFKRSEVICEQGSCIHRWKENYKLSIK